MCGQPTVCGFRRQRTRKDLGWLIRPGTHQSAIKFIKVPAGLLGHDPQHLVQRVAIEQRVGHSNDSQGPQPLMQLTARTNVRTTNRPSPNKNIRVKGAAGARCGRDGRFAATAATSASRPLQA